MPNGCSLLILAGGQSRRMGRDKATLLVDGVTLVEHLAGRLGGVVDEVLVAGGPALGDSALRQVVDRVPGSGPLGGMRAGFLAARFPLIWVVACDLPEVAPDLGPLLCRQAAGVDAAVPLIAERHQGLCAVYRRGVGPRIEALLQADRRSVRGLLATISVRDVTEDELRHVDPELRSFRNLNTPADYEAWLKRR